MRWPLIVTYAFLYGSQCQASDAPMGCMIDVFSTTGSGSFSTYSVASDSTFTRTSLYL